jgi:YcaO-like protein with predicted kinase domain
MRIDLSVGPTKTFRAGTHRLVSPEQTLERVRPHLASMGITRIANVTGLDYLGIPVVMVCRPNSRSLSVSQGKGLTLAAARASGVMESIETYHAEHISQPLKLGSYADLRKELNLVEPAELPSTRGSAYHPHLPLLWIEGYDLIGQASTWVPYELVHTNYSVPFPSGWGCFPATSNGLASGNHVLEAISHAITEVVERDAATLALFESEDARQARRVDLDSVDDPECRGLLERFGRAGFSVAVWEITSDVGIPAFTCAIAEKDADGWLRPFSGAEGRGCHPTRRVALSRALTEAAQSRLTAIAGSRDDLARSDYARVQDASRSLAEPGQSLRRFDQAPNWEGETLLEDVRWELERLQAVGVRQVLAVDLTRQEFGIPVVRVVIPGLESVGPDLYALYSPGARARARLGRAA